MLSNQHSMNQSVTCDWTLIKPDTWTKSTTKIWLNYCWKCF